MARRRGGRVRRLGRRLRHMHRPQSLLSKATSAGALLIGFSPIIADTKTYIIDNHGDFTGFTEKQLENYTGFDYSGHFDGSRLVRGYGPLVAALVFKKVAGMIIKRARLKF